PPWARLRSPAPALRHRPPESRPWNRSVPPVIALFAHPQTEFPAPTALAPAPPAWIVQSLPGAPGLIFHPPAPIATARSFSGDRDRQGSAQEPALRGWPGPPSRPAQLPPLP